MNTELMNRLVKNTKMKLIKTSAAILIAISMSITAIAQKINSAQVPIVVRSAFATAYPAVKTIKWEKEKGNFEAGFKQSDNTMSALFKSDGTPLESEMEIKTTLLPAPVLDYVKQHYKGAKIKEAAKITKTDGEVSYEAEVNGKDLLFNSKGTYIKSVKD